MQKRVNIDQDLQGLYRDMETAVKTNKLGSVNLNKYLGYQIKPSAKLVCAKIITLKDTIVECVDCRMDSSCIICIDCFNNGDHKGHKYRMRVGAGGCCDCGDKEAWKPSGFCKNHSGQTPTVEISKDKNERFVREWQLLFYIYFHTNSSELGNYLCRFLRIFVENMEYNIMLSNLLTTKFDIQRHPKLGEALYSQPIIDSILTLAPKQNHKAFEEMFIAMFPNYEFKKILIVAFIRNYSRIAYMKSAYESLSCQLFTSYELISYAISTPSGVIQFKGEDVDFELQRPFDPLRVYLQALNYLSKLSNGVNIQYFKLFFKDWNNLDNLSYFVDQVQEQWKGNHEDSLITDKFYIQLESLLQIMDIIRIFKDDQQYIYETTVRLIQHLKDKVYANKCYFLPHRVLALFVFLVYDSCYVEHINHIDKLLKDNPKIFFPFFRCIHFMLSSRANKNIKDLHSDYFSYYVDYWHTAFSVDVIIIKLYIRLTEVRDFIDIYMLNSHESEYESYRMIQQKVVTPDTFETLKVVSCLLAFLNELCTSQCQEVHLYNKLHHGNGKYSQEVRRLLTLFFKSEKFVTEETLKAFKRVYLNDEMNIDAQLKQLCKYDKNNKQYTLKTDENLYFPIQFFMSKTSVFKNAENDKRQISKQAVRIDGSLVKILYNESCVDKIANMAQNILKMLDYKDEQQVCSCCMLIRQLVHIHYLTNSQRLVKILRDVSEDDRMLSSLNESSKSYILSMHPKEQKVENTMKKDHIKEIQRKKMEAMKNAQKLFSQKNSKQLQKCEEQLVEAVDTCVYCHHSIDESMFFYCGCRTKNNVTGSFRPFLTSCRHKLHYECLKSYSGARAMLICPLCKRYTNIIIPIWNKVQLLDFENTRKKINEIVHFMQNIEIESSGQQLQDTLLKGSTRLLLSIMDLLTYHAIHDAEYYNKRVKTLYQQLFVTIKASTLFLFKKQSKQRREAILSTINQINKTKFTEYQQVIVQCLIQALEDNSRIPEILVKYNIQPHKGNIIRDFFRLQPIAVKQQMEVENTDETVKFMQLPQKYMPLAEYRKECRNCKNIGSPIHICLVCDWVGCMKCKVQPIRKHAVDKHGGSCLFLNVQTTRYVMVGNGKVGVGDTTLYINEIGKMFNIFQNWEEYSLNEQEYSRLKWLYIRQELPIEIYYKLQGKYVLENLDDF